MGNKYWLISLGYFRFFRIKEWFYIIGLAYLGLFSGTKQFFVKDYLHLFIIASLYLAHGYSINNYFDLKCSRVNVLDIYGEYFNVKLALIVSILLFLINLTVAFYFSKSIFILVIMGGIVSFLYSSSLLRLKEKPFLNIALNSTGFTIVFLLGYLINSVFGTSAFCLGGYIWLGIVPSQIIHLLAHRDIEHNWPFSLKDSLIMFYLSLVIWVVWPLIFFYKEWNRMAFFFSTLVFCMAQVIVMESYQCRNNFTVDKMVKIRNVFRIINIIFGLCLAILFIMLI